MNGEHTKMARSKAKLTRRQRDELRALAALPDDRIDTSDVPETRRWQGARRGVLYRPVKRQLTLRLDADVVTWFQERVGAGGKGYQTAINKALREYIGARRSFVAGERQRKP
jgi:uncharacterized protein (DUF4415 family)